MHVCYVESWAACPCMINCKFPQACNVHPFHAGEWCWRRLKAHVMKNWGWAFPLLRSFSGLPVGEALVKTYSRAAITAPKVLTSLEGFKEHVWCARNPSTHSGQNMLA